MINYKLPSFNHADFYCILAGLWHLGKGLMGALGMIPKGVVGSEIFVKADAAPDLHVFFLSFPDQIDRGSALSFAMDATA